MIIETLEKDLNGKYYLEVNLLEEKNKYLLDFHPYIIFTYNNGNEKYKMLQTIEDKRLNFKIEIYKNVFIEKENEIFDLYQKYLRNEISKEEFINMVKE